jgi:PIN domain nuclease of toxin-antitoxin system
MDPARISKRARTALDEARTGDSGIAISDMTLPEPAKLCRTRQVHLNTSLEEFLGEVERRFVVLPMNRRICAEAFDLPATYPKDPADRIIGATALVKGRT